MSGNGQEIAKLAGWVAGGTIMGVGLGMLFAPRPGVDTRRTVVRQARRAQVEVIRVGRAVQSGVTEMKKRFAAKRDTQSIGEAA